MHNGSFIEPNNVYSSKFLLNLLLQAKFTICNTLVLLGERNINTVEKYYEFAVFITLFHRFQNLSEL